ncbi:glycosyltransferase [Streptomyces sp. NPDC060194]|uniref:glycosyltransferase family 2 protein n=1 Tax=Streptomyces sp. NPDC060194 TaxID=3347069 RepID=UPI003650FA60
MLAAHQHRSSTVLFGFVVLGGVTVWTGLHVIRAMEYDAEAKSRLSIVWSTIFLAVLLQTVLYHLDRPRRLTPRIARQLADLRTAILMPVYNEDPGLLKLGLESFLRQTRLPDAVHVVDDGSKNSADLEGVRRWWEQAARAAGVRTTWQRTPNGGKRHAQAAGVRQAPDADVFITCDSDSCFAPNAIEEILTPFARPRVQSVAGIVVATNNRKNVLARITDLWFTTSQLVDRSGQSAVGAVTVNSGPLAAYRADILRDNLDSYLNEVFLGRPVMFSDDSLLTLYAQERGLTVQQPSAIVFSAMPEKWSHFVRMYLRWMRGSAIRSIWRMRYLPVNRPAFWMHLVRWIQVLITQMVLVWMLVVEPLAYGNRPPASMLWIPFLMGWAQGLRYLSIIRSDERIRSRIATWLMMPLAIVMAWTLLRWLRWWGVLTCRKTGWGTRENGAEVSLSGAEAEQLTGAVPVHAYERYAGPEFEEYAGPGHAEVDDASPEYAGAEYAGARYGGRPSPTAPPWEVPAPGPYDASGSNGPYGPYGPPVRDDETMRIPQYRPMAHSW